MQLKPFSITKNELDRRKEMNVKELIEEVENDVDLASYISLLPKGNKK